MGRKYILNAHGRASVNDKLTSKKGLADPAGKNPPACQSSKVWKAQLPSYLDPKSFDPKGLIHVTRFKSGDKLSWPSFNEPPAPPDERERASLQQSAKSRLNAAFRLGNAETKWLAMATLTYRVNPDDYETVERHRNQFRDRIRKRFKDAEWSWILEFQKRGAAHFHFFLGNGGELGNALSHESTESVKRKGNETEIFTGEVSRFIVESWIDIVGDTDPRFLKFQRGGIVEKMRSPDAAGRYAAKEAAKRVQKVSPWPVKQWWSMSRNITPKERSYHKITIEDFILQFPDLPLCSRLWGHAEI